MGAYRPSRWPIVSVASRLPPQHTLPPAPRILLEQAEALLAPLYGEPHRHYHTLAHIHGMLSGLDACLHQAKQPDLIRLAIWFHDAIYDPHRHDNEAQSADLAREHLTQWGAPVEWVSRISAMIEATAQHEWLDGDSDTALFLDLDLAILGMDSAVYDRYAQQVRQEYSWVPDELYRAGRCRVLQRFQARSVIYFTEWHRQQYESQARLNVGRELSGLIAQP